MTPAHSLFISYHRTTFSPPSCLSSTQSPVSSLVGLSDSLFCSFYYLKLLQCLAVVFKLKSPQWLLLTSFVCCQPCRGADPHTVSLVTLAVWHELCHSCSQGYTIFPVIHDLQGVVNSSDFSFFCCDYRRNDEGEFIAVIDLSGVCEKPWLWSESGN